MRSESRPLVPMIKYFLQSLMKSVSRSTCVLGQTVSDSDFLAKGIVSTGYQLFPCWRMSLTKLRVRETEILRKSNCRFESRTVDSQDCSPPPRASTNRQNHATCTPVPDALAEHNQSSSRTCKCRGRNAPELAQAMSRNSSRRTLLDADGKPVTCIQDLRSPQAHPRNRYCTEKARPERKEGSS